MRQLISFLFITLFLLNVLGYYGVFVGLQYENSRKVNQQLDLFEYNEKEAVTFKIPLTIPYIGDSREYERVTGEFEYNGEFYRLVKQQLTRDTLHIVCVKDNQSKRIHQALETYVKTFADKPSGKQQGSSKATTQFIKDYLPQTFSLIQGTTGWEIELPRRATLHFLISDFYPSIVHPPERS